MKSIWKGTISFGLVSIPIKLYSAVDQQSIGFHMVCKKCNERVQYKKVCPGCGKEEVTMKDIVKGLEISKGEYLLFTDEELEKLRPEKSDRIEIREFVDSDELDIIYYDKPYFCGPAQARDRSYFLFMEVLKTTGKIAIGKFIMRQKEYLCAIRPYQTGLLLSTLNYKYEVRDINDIRELKDAPDLNKSELELAIKLVDQLYEKDFKIEEFRDTFKDQLREMIANQSKGRKPRAIKRRIEEKPLLEALKASLK
jgi:DNA end-binding protein Ku